MPDLGMKKRTNVLTHSLLVESMTSIFLAKLLGIEDVANSKTLGNNSSAISFNQKIHLLIDINALDSSVKKKLQVFMEVRNQFMHNYGAKTFELCFEFIKKDKANSFLKEYPQDVTKTKEEQLELAFEQLCKEIIQIIKDLFEEVKVRITNNVRNELALQFKSDTFEAIKEVEETFNSMFTQDLKNGLDNISTSDIKDLGTLVREKFYSIINEKANDRDNASKVVAENKIAP